MAVVSFQPQASNVNGSIWLASGLSTGDSTSDLAINQGDAEVAVQISGTLGGSSVSIVGMIAGGVFSTVDDAFGDAMVYTSVGSIGIVKPVGPALSSLRGVVNGGSGVSVDIAVYIPSRRG